MGIVSGRCFLGLFNLTRDCLFFFAVWVFCLFFGVFKGFIFFVGIFVVFEFHKTKRRVLE